MTNKEKLELKIELLEDLKECFSFNFGSMSEDLSKSQIEELYQRYCEKYNEIKEEEKNNS